MDALVSAPSADGVSVVVRHRPGFGLRAAFTDGTDADLTLIAAELFKRGLVSDAPAASDVAEPLAVGTLVFDGPTPRVSVVDVRRGTSVDVDPAKLPALALAGVAELLVDGVVDAALGEVPDFVPDPERPWW